MAERRMFAKTIVLSDAFLDMPMSARCLYFSLGMVADDDGFINNFKSIMRQIGSSNDDLKVLISKKYIIPFDDGVIVIKHWRINNYLRSDRHTPTEYAEDMNKIEVKENGSYSVSDNTGIPVVDQCVTQYRLGKDSIGKYINNINKKDINIICSESSEESSELAPVEAIILNDQSSWKPTLEQYEEYKRLYPGIDIDSEFRKMRAWSMSNLPKRKTKRGVERFVNSWLSRSQDRGYKKPDDGYRPPQRA